jgi:hypothetical protein
MSGSRRIFRSSTTSNAEIRELLEALFVAELLRPSRCLWLVSPWFTDLDVLDNRSAAFASLDPQWGPRQMRLVELLGRLLKVGSRVVVSTRPVEHNNVFLAKLEDLAESLGATQLLTIHRRDTLHLKGFLGDDFYLSGSMNLTFNGVEILEEGVTLESSPEAVAFARVAFLDSYGGIA